jgi:hypothetical protein
MSLRPSAAPDAIPGNRQRAGRTAVNAYHGRRRNAGLSALLVSVLWLPLNAVADGLCAQWSEPGQTGQLDITTLQEASGIGISPDGSRLYHINDGNEPVFYVTDRQGGAVQKVRVSGFSPQDVEDMAVGRCGGEQCLILADTGDNARRRDSVQFALIAAQERFDAQVSPLRIVSARYPDGPHDAEASAVLPSGDLLVVTKSRVGFPGPATLFRLRAAQLQSEGMQVFEKVGELPVPDLTGTGLNLRRVVTAMDASADGRRLLLLTYDAAIEVAVGADGALPGAWQEGKTHRSFAIAPMVQAEAVAWEPGGQAVLYSTESVRGSAAPLMRQSCLHRAD